MDTNSTHFFSVISPSLWPRLRAMLVPPDDLEPTCPDDMEPANTDVVRDTMPPSPNMSCPFHFRPKYDHAEGMMPIILLHRYADDDEMCQDLSTLELNKRVNFWRSESLPWRLTVGALVSFGIIPAVHSACTMSRGFRVASGMTSTMTAMAVVPLRTASHIPQAAWIATYVAWTICFSIYIWLQLINIRHGPGPQERRTIYILAVVFASFHFMAGLSQGAESVLDGAAMFGPIAATASAYFMSLLITINWRETGRAVYELA